MTAAVAIFRARRALLLLSALENFAAEDYL